jgi:hypothetical protein
LRTAASRVQFPAAAPFSNKSRTSLCGRVSKTQPAWGSTRATCQWGRGRQAMHLPCKQAYVGALPALPTSLRPLRRGRRRLPRRSSKSAGGRYLPQKAASARQTISGLVAQLAERPVVCGRVEGATPFGSAISSECSSVFRAPGLGLGGRRWKSCHSDQLNCCRGRTHEASVF